MKRERGKKERPSYGLYSRIEGFADDRPRKMNSRARNAISRSGEIYLAREPGLDYLVALLSPLYHRQRALRHLDRLETLFFLISFVARNLKFPSSLFRASIKIYPSLLPFFRTTINCSSTRI